MIHPDGSLLVTGTQNDLSTTLFSLRDTGSSLEVRWRAPIGPIQWSNVGVGPDGTIYTLSTGNTIVGLDPADGSVRHESAPVIQPDPRTTCRVAVDSAGQVYVGLTPVWSGMLHAFDASLNPLWQRPVTSSPVGGPSLAEDGSLVLSTNTSGLEVWR